MEILQRFVSLCDHAPWSIEDFAAHIGEQVKKEVGNRKVFMLVSGGVDSTVAFTLLDKTLGEDRVYGLLVDTGLMRKNEVGQIRAALSRLSLDNLHVEDASELFCERLKNVYDPEEKRNVIGQAFLDVQRDVAKRLKLDGPEWPASRSSPKESEGWMLGQGTIYPDTIETGGTKHADRIKTHHNRIPEIQKMIAEGRVIEPLKDLYKDEVRKLGEMLGLPHDLVWRHPFPGPGLGVRILCAEKEDRLTQEQEEMIGVRSDFYAFRVLPIKSVGVQGDGRTYRHPLAIFMRKSLSDLKSLFGLATSIPNRHPEINRVLLCTSHSTPVAFVCTPSFVTRARADLLRSADATVDEEMRRTGLYESIWQFPVVLLPIGTTPGGQSIVLRPVESQEAMTANAFHLPAEFIKRVTEKLLTLPGIDLVFYDLTSKPPATIEWE
jgi:GMP synthase (glutamine-hydrolysing)